MKSEYYLLLCSFIKKCNNVILFRFLVDIFNNDYPVQIKYKLLKIYYFSRKQNLNETTDKNQIDIGQTYSDLFTNQINLPPSNIQQEERYRELIKSILYQLLFEAKSKNYLLFLNDNIIKGKDCLMNNTMGLITLTKQKLNNNEDSLTNLSYQSANTYGESKSLDNSKILLKNIPLGQPISFNLVKSIFILNYDDWDSESKISFISNNKIPTNDNYLQLYESIDLCLNEFNRIKKNHIAYFINLLYKMDTTNESIITLDNSILLFINYLFQIFRAYSQSQQNIRPNIKCQYVHLFESKAIMCSFLTIAFDSINTSKYALTFLQKITENLLWKHSNCFIYKFAYISIKRNPCNMYFLLNLITSGFNSNICNLPTNGKIPEDKSINIITFLIVCYKLICFNRISKDLLGTDRFIESLLILLQSFKEKSRFLYSNLLLPISKKYKINKPLYDVVIELIYKIFDITDRHYHMEALYKILTLNKNSFCFYIDLKGKKTKDKKENCKDSIQESDIQLCEAEIKSKYNLKEREGKLAVVIIYIHSVRFIISMKEKGFDVQIDTLLKTLQSEIGEIYNLLGFTYFDKDNDSIYNKVIKQMMVSWFNKNTKASNDYVLLNQMFGCIGNVICQDLDEEFNDKGSSIAENKNRKDSFSSCSNKCNENIRQKKEVSSPLKKQFIKADKVIPSIFDIDSNYIILCMKRDLLLKPFGIYFRDVYFSNDNFAKIKRIYKGKYPSDNSSNSYFNQTEKQELKFPSKLKNYSSSKTFYPKIFLKQDLNFFEPNNKYLSVLFPRMDKSIFRKQSLKLKHGLLNRSDLKLFSDKTSNMINSLGIYPSERISIENICFGNIYVYYHFIIYQSEPDFSPKVQYASNPNYTFSSFDFDMHQEKKQIIIQISQIKEIISKRYLFKNQAIEIFLLNGKSYLFNLFSNRKQSEFIKQLEELNSKISFIIDMKTHFFEVNEFHSKWKSDQLSTFDYLLQINKYAGRSYNDLNQYPLIPWFFSQLKPQLTRRNFQFPISIQGDEAKAKALLRFDSLISENHVCHFNIHYSHSAFINTYLVRVFPFTYNQIKFQNNKFDVPERQFHSIESMLSKLERNNDNRELIPEIFTMSEFALNLNYCEFGRRNNDDQLINNLELPEVFASPASLMIFFKNSLNAYPVKEKIHLWIDYVFGVNQKDRRKECLTIFQTETYESTVLQQYEEIQKKYEGDTEKLLRNIKSTIITFISLGQTPYQLFDAPHPVYTRDQGSNGKDFLNPVREIFYENQLINRSLLNNKVAYVCKSNSSNSIFFLDRKSSNKAIVISDEDLNFKSKFFVGKMTFLNKVDDYLIYHPKYSVAEFSNCDSFLTCRYYNNTINMYIISKKIKYTSMTESFVSCIKLINLVSFYSGHQNGKIICWSIVYIEGVFDSIQPVQSILAHEKKVTAIEVNHKIEVFISGGDDHMVYIRKMYDFELLNIISMTEVFIPVDIQMSSIFDLIYIKVYNSATNLFHLALYSLNGLCFEEMKAVKWFDFLISDLNKIIYLDSTNTLIQLSRDLKQIMKSVKLKEEVVSFTFLEKEKEIIYSYGNGIFEKIHFDPS